MPEDIKSYKDLIVWQRSVDLAVSVYRLTRTWPKEELYSLTSQVRRAATSIAANIAEGYGRDSRASYQQFLRIAQGSLKELETHLIIAEKAGVTAKDSTAQILLEADEIGRMLRRLIAKLSPP